MDAFAGELSTHDGAFRWEPVLRLNHHDGPPDEGRLAWMGDDLWEEGVHIPYAERWIRIAEAVPGDFAVALASADGDEKAFLLNVGAFVFHAGTGAAAGAGEFSLFETKPEGARLVLSTVGDRTPACPQAEFASEGGVWLSAGGSEAERLRTYWRVLDYDDCGMPAATAETGR
jgi:hypothetical protein